MKLSKGTWTILIVFLVLIIDQTVKIWIKTHMELYESIPHMQENPGRWFYIYFTENNGMAFGWEFFDKIFLTLFRLVASGAIAYYLWTLVKRNYRTGYLVCVSLIFAGAVGNIIDCVFYGVLFDSSYGQVATFLPEGGGYASLLHGRVVDMLYFPIIQTTWPSWVPHCGGEPFIFFRPIFNIADASISVGIILLLLFFRKDLSSSLEKKTNE